jgi:CDP-4-dehydro-6-deoxyglucose reductase
MWLISTIFKKQFFQADGQILLEAAASTGLSLPYSCKTGRCSSCKCRVLRGQSTAVKDELGLTAEEKAQGFILSCVRSATSDLLIDVEDLCDLVLPEVKILPARISSLEKLAKDVLCVKFRLPNNIKFTFLAGQYIDVIGPNALKRSYSLANAPLPDKQIELHIRSVQFGEMSDYWFNYARVNDLVRFNGPLGSFFTRPLKGLHLIFLATGTGIAPIKAMLEQLATAAAIDQPLSITLYWGGRYPQDLYLDPSQWYPELRYIPVLSRTDDGSTTTGNYVQKAVLRDAPDLNNAVVYACGSGAMIRSARSELTFAGLPSRCFYSDSFVPSGTQLEH